MKRAKSLLRLSSSAFKQSAASLNGKGPRLKRRPEPQAPPPPSKKAPFMPAQLIFVSDKPFDVKKAKDFSKKNGWSFSTYTKEEWSGKGEEIFLVHDEAESADFQPLPSGYRPVFSLEEIEAYTIEKALSICQRNVSKAARLLRIGRATLYRKIDHLGLETQAKRKSRFDRPDNVLEMPLKKDSAAKKAA